MVDQKIGLRELLQKMSVVITKCGKFLHYKLWQVLLQTAAATLLHNGNLYYKKEQVLQTEQLYYKIR